MHGGGDGADLRGSRGGMGSGAWMGGGPHLDRGKVLAAAERATGRVAALAELGARCPPLIPLSGKMGSQPCRVR
jgi:hypothetical protein